MAPQPNFTPLVRKFREAKDRSGLAFDEIWRRYSNRGGEVGRSTLIGYFQGTTIPQVDQHDLIAAVLNDELSAQGKEPSVPQFYFGTADPGDPDFVTPTGYGASTDAGRARLRIVAA